MQVRMIRSMTGPEGTECRKNESVEVDADTAQRWIDGGVAEALPVPDAPVETPAPKSRKSTAAPSGE